MMATPAILVLKQQVSEQALRPIRYYRYRPFRLEEKIKNLNTINNQPRFWRVGHANVYQNGG
jgi:hypothetical protein